MNMNGKDKSVSQKKISRYIYLITLFFLVLTGFAQMPIFKRYYIADIPGFGWLAQFYITYYIHYIAAVLIIGFFAYYMVAYLTFYQKHHRISISGYIRVALLAGLVITGICLVLKNFTGYWFSPGFIIILDFSHLGLTILFLVVALYCLIFKKRYVLENRP